MHSNKARGIDLKRSKGRRKIKTSAQQPKGFLILFIVTVSESFSIYGVRGVFILYLSSELFFNDHNAYGAYGAFGALLYSLPFLGGLLADLGFGLRRAIIAGSLIMILGFVILLCPVQNSFYIGIGMVICGYAFFKPNLTSLLGKLYQDKDPRRDAGFSLFFVASNVGAFSAPLICGYIGYAYSWSYAFGLAGIGMMAALLIFLKWADLFKAYDQNISNHTFTKLGKLKFRNIIYFGLFPLIAALSFLMGHRDWMSILMPASFGAVVIWLLKLAFKCPQKERSNIFTLLILLGFVLAFDVCFEQAWSSINFFVDRVVARNVYGFEIPASWFLGINPLLVIFFGPLFSALWLKLEQRRYPISVEIKFMAGLMALAFGFIGFYLGAQMPDSHGLVNPLWIFLGYALHTIGELCIIPVGISMVSKLSPKNYASTFMGFWYLVWAFSHYLAGQVAKLTALHPEEEAFNSMKYLKMYGDVFLYMTAILLVLSLLLLLLRPYLRPVLKRVED